MVEARVGSLAQLLGGEVLGDAGLRLTRLGTLRDADGGTIAFLAHPRYASQMAHTLAGCVIVGPAHREAAARLPSAIVCADPYLAYARLSQWWALQLRPAAPAGIHPSAIVDPTALVDPSAAIGPLAVIGAAAVIGAGAQVGAHGVVGVGAHLGCRTLLAARVVLGDRCSIGDDGIVHSGAVIGADGFGFAPSGGTWEKIEQLGAVRIGNRVEIGANTCIDRGALEDTVIEDGVKLDNLIQVGHNVRIGAHTAMAGCVGVAGSARIGARCTLGGGAIVLGHLELVDDVHISAATVVTRSIRKPGQYSGVFPFDDNTSWERNAATLRQLHSLRDRIRALEAQNR